MMTVGPLEDDFLSPGLVEYSRRMCGIYMDCASSPIKPLSDIIIHFKILVPGVAAGAIIGKGGETIAQLQKDAGARVKMSKANDFYPGTTERVCLITGTIESVFFVLRFVQEKIREKPDLHAKPAIDYDSKLIVDRDRQVKILVPNSTAGMVIGKAGNYIKQLKEESGAYVQISQKAKDQTLSERCITVIGDGESCRRACLLILHKVAEDPQSGSCLNVSYADIAGPVANFNPTGSPFAASCGSSGASVVGANGSICNGAGSLTPVPGSSYDLSPLSMSALSNPCSDNDSVLCSPPVLPPTGLRLQLNPQSGFSPGNSLSPMALDQIHTSLRAGGYSEQAANEVTAAIGVLSRYGILGVSPNAASYSGSPAGISAAGGVQAMSSPCLRLPASRYAANSVVCLPSNQSLAYLPNGESIDSAGYGTSGSAALLASQNCASGSYGLSPSQPALGAGGERLRYEMYLSGSGSDIRARGCDIRGSSGVLATHMPVNHNSYGLGTPQTLARLQRQSSTPSPSPSPPPLHPPAAHHPHLQYQQQSGERSSCCQSPTEAYSPPISTLRLSGPARNQTQQKTSATNGDGDGHRQQIEVSEFTVETVLGGADGTELAEIQRLSGALVQISRTEGATGLCVLSLVGSTQAVSTAQYLIEQKIGEHQAKHTTNGH